MQLNAVNLAGSVFLNFALLALTEMPSVFVGQFTIDRLGRRWSHFSCMLLASGTLPVHALYSTIGTICMPVLYQLQLVCMLFIKGCFYYYYRYIRLQAFYLS